MLREVPLSCKIAQLHKYTAPNLNKPALPWRGVKLQEGVLQGVIQLHDAGLIAAPVAVVGGGEDGDHVPIVTPVVALHHQLMGPAHQGQAVRMVECLGYILQVIWLTAVKYINGNLMVTRSR